MKTKHAGLLVLAFLVAGLSPAFPIGTNFSGTWILDKEKSDPGIGRRKGRGGEARNLNLMLEVSQSADELVITRKLDGGKRKRDREVRLKLDGTETTNTAMRGRGEVKSKARLEGDRLVVENTRPAPSRRGDTQIQEKEEWSLSSDGRSLTITRTIPSRRGDRLHTQVYTKQ